MTELRKAAEQALETLETLDVGDSYKTHNAASALRQALEDHVDLATVGEVGVWGEKPPVKTYSGGKPNYCTPVDDVNISAERVDETAKRKDEPVVWIKDDEIAFMSAARMLGATEWKTNLGLKPEHGDVPLYTAPPKCEWVGLTDEEIGTLTVFDGLTHIEVPILTDFIRAIEAKLKEKNNA